jgi:DNA-binding response OmpR family regulator
MRTSSPRILCIGKDSGLLRSRVAILEHAGYYALDVMVQDAGELLAQEQFDLIILSAILTDDEKNHIRSLVSGTTPILALKKLVFASELLREVESHLTTVT